MATRKLTDLKRGKTDEQMAREDAGSIFDMGIDDIDHLGNRRVRTVGELLANVCRSGQQELKEWFVNADFMIKVLKVYLQENLSTPKP